MAYMNFRYPPLSPPDPPPDLHDRINFIDRAGVRMGLRAYGLGLRALGLRA